MRGSDLLTWMQDPKRLDEETLVQLERVVEDYPFFQTARYLYVLNLYHIGDTRFSSELKKAVCGLPDRRKLFYDIEHSDFPADWRELLEKGEEVESQSAFDLIDLFLKERGEMDAKGDAIEVDQLVNVDYLSYLQRSDDEPTPEAPAFQRQDVIDRFIKADKEAPIKLSLTPSDDEPEETTEESQPVAPVAANSFFSETLAKIYLKQKKYEKALEIINQLHLLYPEKNLYFADQIRFLETLIINTRKTK